MMHSQMPVQSLLCTLLMLPLGMPTGLSHMPIPNSVAPIAAAFAVIEYNMERHDSATYFKALQILYGQSPADLPNRHNFNARLVKTVCLKMPGSILPYKRIEQCRQLPGSTEIHCYFKVTAHPGGTMTLDVKRCSDTPDTNRPWSPQIRTS
ncbi:cystatin-1-like [Crotalus tigris]|uniref:cystatin-1-like n=1 Tax=Crotalus tigris TaxID=88082 RepID=UPI00192FB0A9|nr:cystatin-1-like [Crotalus tigris]